MTNYRINNYGELIAKATNGILWSYEEYGDYEGDYIAILEKDNALHIYKGSYGSCSGCDWLQSEGEYESDESTEQTIKDEKIQEYMIGTFPFVIIPKESMPDTVEELISLFPGNTRIWNWDEDEKEEYQNKLEKVLEQLHTPEFSNLDYLEARYDQKSEK